MWLAMEVSKYQMIDLQLAECLVWMVVQLCSASNMDLTCFSLRRSYHLTTATFLRFWNLATLFTPLYSLNRKAAAMRADLETEQNKAEIIHQEDSTLRSVDLILLSAYLHYLE